MAVLTKTILIKIIEDEVEKILKEKDSKKPLCLDMNPNHGSDGKFSTPSSATSWSVRTGYGRSDCSHGQRKANPSRWLKTKCGREDRKNPNKKAKYRCKDSKPVNEAQDYKNCSIVSMDKEYKEDKKTKKIKVHIKREIECDYTDVKPSTKTIKNLQKLNKLEKDLTSDRFDDNRVSITRDVFKKYLKWADNQAEDLPDKPTNEESNRERKSRVFGDSWNEFVKLSKGIY